ncbi:MAG: ribonuclease III [Rhizobiales bacterium]|nr:ribonuclease III [Hyphomicrobiales bacterium]
MSRKPKGNRVANSSPASDLSRPLPAPSLQVGVGKEAAVRASPNAKPVRRRRKTPAGFEERIGYKFKDVALLEQALTHISALTGSRNRSGSYQRLEFLGDHVLGLVISDMLFGAFPKADEGELSRRLADLVRKEACADVARVIDLGTVIRLGASENNAGGRNRTAILADVCEALIGAIFIDGGYKSASEVIRRLWEQRMRVPTRPLRDSKTILQEWAQARGLPTPAYREVERKGPDHNPEFRVTVELPNREPAEGVGRSKRAAEQAAAAAMLTREGVDAEPLDG